MLVLSLFFAAGCAKDIGPLNYGDYPSEIGKIISGNCSVSGCHNTASYLAASGYNLTTWKDMFSGSSNGSPVIPFSSRFSSLCYFINTFDDLGPKNTPVMPFNAKPLSRDQVVLIKNWIDKGAPDRNGNVWASDPQRKKLYAVNQGCDVVTVFDSETQLPIRYIDVGNKPGIESPHQVKVSPDGKYWYVVFVNNNVMQKFRCSDDSYVGQIPLTPYAAGISSDPLADANNWNTFVISADSKRAYCVSWQSNGRVCAVDLENMKFLHDLPALDNPHGIALNAAQNKLYVTGQYGNSLTLIDTSFGSGGTELSLQNGILPNHIQSPSSLDPHDIILSPDGANFLVTCQNSNEVRVLNIASSSVTQIIAAGSYPQEIVYSKSFNQYFVTCTNDTANGAHGTVLRIDGTSFSATKLRCGYQPHGIAVDETKKLLYVLSRNISSSGPPPHHTSQCQGKNGFVNFVDMNNFTVLSRRYELSVDPYFIYPRP